MNEPPLTMEGVVKTWRGRATPVLGGVDIDLAPGSLVWLSGDNGAGKTTLLRLACGLLDPDAGNVLVCGRSLSAEPRECKRRIGVLMAGNTGLWARLTVRQQLELWARLAFVSRDERRPAIERTIKELGLDALANRRLDRISMGERQRLRLAMCFLHRPALVLLDEPRNSLDEAGLGLLRQALSELRGRGGSVLWCAPTGESPEVDPTTTLRVADGQLVLA